MNGLLLGEPEHSDPSGPSPLSGGLVREEQPSHPIPGAVESSEQDENRLCAEEDASVTPVVSHAPDDSRDNGGESREAEQSAQPGCRTSGNIGPSPQYAPCPLPAQLSNPDCPEIAPIPITDDAQQASQALEQCYKQALQGLLATVKAQWWQTAKWLTNQHDLLDAAAASRRNLRKIIGETQNDSTAAEAVRSLGDLQGSTADFLFVFRSIFFIR